MNMIAFKDYVRLIRFRNFFEQELAKHPIERERRIGFLSTRFFSDSIARENIYEELKMVKKSTKNKFEWKGYANITIPQSEESKVVKFIADDKAVYERYTVILRDGYKIAFQSHEEEESIKITATCYDPDDPNYGMALSAYAHDWYTALAVLLYKHFEVSDTVWTDYQAPDKRAWG